MTGALIAIAHRGARGVEQAGGTISETARPAFTAGDVKIHGGSMRGLLSRGLIVGTVRPTRAWAAFEITDYVPTEAGWAAIAAEYGHDVRPDWTQPDLFDETAPSAAQDPNDAQGGTPDGEAESEPADPTIPRAHGEGDYPPDMPVGTGIAAWGADDVAHGEMPLTGEPLRTATVPRQYRTGRDGACAPYSGPGDDDPAVWWMGVPAITIPRLR